MKSLLLRVFIVEWLVVCLVFMPGCATLKVTVDVYKGPLVNDPSTQVQQLAALAMAAKPILEDLINEMEHEIGSGKSHTIPKMGNSGQAMGFSDGQSKGKLIMNLYADGLRRLVYDYTVLDDFDRSKFIQSGKIAVAILRNTKASDEDKNKAIENSIEMASKVWLNSRNLDVKKAVAGIANYKVSGLVIDYNSYADNLQTVVGTMESQVGNALPAGGSGQNTRSPVGLDWYVSVGLNANLGPINDNADKAIREMRGVLAYFGAKLLAIDDYKKIIASSSSVRAFNTSLLGDAWDMISYKPKIGDQIRVLQAIGSSILALADELEQSDKWHKNESKQETISREVERAMMPIYGEGYLYLLAIERIASAKKATDSDATNKQHYQTIASAAQDIRAACLKQGIHCSLTLAEAKKRINEVLDPKSKVAAPAPATPTPATPTPATPTPATPTPATPTPATPTPATPTPATPTPATPTPATGAYEKYEKLQADYETVGTINTLANTYFSRSEVVDDLLAAFYYQRVVGLAHGANVDLLADAIKALAARKAQLTRIRPPGAILRTTTKLSLQDQDDGASGADRFINMIIDALPLPEKLTTSRKTLHERWLAEQLDRVSWQTINKIKLQGVGDTNYVLVKDDIGNWYVRNYSADPSQAIKSMSDAITRVYLPHKGLINTAAKKATTEATSSTEADIKKIDDEDKEKHAKIIKDLIENVKMKKPDTAVLSNRQLNLNADFEEIEKDYELNPDAKAERIFNACLRYLAQDSAAGANPPAEKSNDGIKKYAGEYYKSRRDQLENKRKKFSDALINKVP